MSDTLTKAPPQAPTRPWAKIIGTAVLLVVLVLLPVLVGSHVAY